MPLAGPVEETRTGPTAAPAKDLDSLTREIGAAVRVNDGKEVEIKFDSKTFAGLEIRIRKEDGKLNVTLRSDSAPLNQMLAGQSDALARAWKRAGLRECGSRCRRSRGPQPSPSRAAADQSGQGGQGRQDQQKQRQR